MLRRLTIGLAAGALMAAMLPGVAAAGHTPVNLGQCIQTGDVNPAGQPGLTIEHVGKRGDANWWVGPLAAAEGLNRAAAAGGMAQAYHLCLESDWRQGLLRCLADP